MRQGQWVKCELPEVLTAFNADGSTKLLQRSDIWGLVYRLEFETIVGVWYPPKTFAGFVKEVDGKRISPVIGPTVWPVDPESGMPLDYGGARLCFHADSVENIRSCTRGDMPPARLVGMDEAAIAKFVEVVDG